MPASHPGRTVLPHRSKLFKSHSSNEWLSSIRELCGETVDVERNAIATAFKNLVAEEMKLLLPVEARVRANRMPALDLIEEFRSTLESVRNGGADDCVHILVGEGVSLKEARDRI